MCFSWRRSASRAARSVCGTHGGEMKELRGKVAAVTGAASGLGRAMALAFADEGMHVALADVEEAKLEPVEAAIREKGGSSLSMRVDVSKAAEVEAFAERTVSELGAVH